jgi:hypothetical protein
LAQRLKVFINGLSAIVHGDDVIGMKLNIQMSCGASAATYAAKAVPHENSESQAGANIPAIFFRAKSTDQKSFRCLRFRIIGACAIAIRPLDERF